VKLFPSGKKLVKKWTRSEADLGSAEYAEPFFRALGAETISAIDSSSYEGADIIFNLNEKLPANLDKRFTCLIDGGTLEHVFDFPTALENCMSMVAVGGHLIICNMANNCMGHGFYQLSPELFYSALSPENGYQVECVLISESRGWYECFSPSKIKGRAQAATRGETLIFCCAKRIGDTKPFSRPPHQSDYVSNLQVSGSSSPQISVERTDLRGRILRLFPFVRNVRDSLRKFKRGFLFRAFPFLAEVDARIAHQIHVRSCQVTNKRCFRRIGHSLPIAST
jgi:hypothetical protein